MQTAQEIQREIMYSDLEGMSYLIMTAPFRDTGKALTYVNSNANRITLPKSQLKHLKRESKKVLDKEGELSHYDTYTTCWCPDWLIEKNGLEKYVKQFNF